ncbi:MAG: hypothetical protein AAF388_15465 [Bacteroidota bacterium]
MQSFIQGVCIHLLQKYEGDIEYILLTGSQLRPKSTDFWSDVDLVITLREWREFNFGDWLHHLSTFYPIIAQEIHHSQESATLRLIMNIDDDVAFLDIGLYSEKKWMEKWPNKTGGYKILYGPSLPEKKQIQHSPKPVFTYSQKKISHIWFLFFQTVKKFMRSDNLIGLHLMLELVREYLVIEMIERDVAKGTHIHRSGDNELLDTSISSLELPFETPAQNLEYLLKLATAFDQKWRQHLSNYQSRLSLFEQYVADSLDKLSP